MFKNFNLKLKFKKYIVVFVGGTYGTKPKTANGKYDFKSRKFDAKKHNSRNENRKTHRKIQKIYKKQINLMSG